MAENSGITWTDNTFNPWIGCTKVSPGCDNCYAERLATTRLGVAWGPHAERRRTTASWKAPRKWERQAVKEGRRIRVFCASLADVFDNQVPPAWREDLWALIRETPHLDWLLLTKRPQMIGRFLPADWPNAFPHVHLGASVVVADEVDRNVGALAAIEGGGIRWLSCEPLLQGVAEKLRPWLMADAVQWVITGGESGPGARPIHPLWVRDLLEVCQAARVAFHFKQWGEWAPTLASSRVGPKLVAMQVDGTRVLPGHGDMTAWLFEKVGVDDAGRHVDGQLHDAFPVQLERAA